MVDNPIDVHVMSHQDGSRKASLDHMIRQLEKEPVNIHVVPGNVCIGHGRALGFTRGSAGLVSYVDDDDEIVEGAYTRILEEFEKFPGIGGAVTRESYEGRFIPFNKHYYDYLDVAHTHHIMTFKRELVEPHINDIADMTIGAEHYLVAKIMETNGVIKHIPEVLYKWVLHEGSATYENRTWPKKATDMFKKLQAKAKDLEYKTHLPHLQKTFL